MTSLIQLLPASESGQENKRTVQGERTLLLITYVLVISDDFNYASLSSTLPSSGLYVNCYNKITTKHPDLYANISDAHSYSPIKLEETSKALGYYFSTVDWEMLQCKILRHGLCQLLNGKHFSDNKGAALLQQLSLGEPQTKHFFFSNKVR